MKTSHINPPTMDEFIERMSALRKPGTKVVSFPSDCQVAILEIREALSIFSAKQFLDNIWPRLEELRVEAENWIKNNGEPGKL